MLRQQWKNLVKGDEPRGGSWDAGHGEGVKVGPEEKCTAGHHLLVTSLQPGRGLGSDTARGGGWGGQGALTPSLPLPCPVQEQPNPHCPSLSLGFLVCLARDEQLVHQAPWPDGHFKTPGNDRPHPNRHGPSGKSREGHHYTWLPRVTSHSVCRCGGNRGPGEDVS